MGNNQSAPEAKPIGDLGHFTTAAQVCQLYGEDLSGKVVIVTGATAGIGKETARALGALKAHIILACRDTTKAEILREEIIRDNIEGQATALELDLSDFNSIRRFARSFIALGLPLHILINNAGIMAPPHYTTTVDGFEMQFGVNHLGHFLLTKLLLPILLKSAPSRVVNLSSIAHRAPGTKWDFNIALLPPKLQDYDAFRNYGCSKLCNILFTKELSRRYTDAGLTSYAVHPGAIKTELGRNNKLVQLAYDVGAASKSIQQGAATSVYCAIMDKVVPGAYYADCQEKLPSDDAQNKSFASLLWRLSLRLVDGKDSPIQMVSSSANLANSSGSSDRSGRDDENMENKDEAESGGNDLEDDDLFTEIDSTESIELNRKSGTAVIPVDMWKSDESTNYCDLCRIEFSATLRRHHCRYCGDLACSRCSQNTMAPLQEQVGVPREPLRCCDECYVGRHWR